MKQTKIGIVGCGAVTRTYYSKFLPLLKQAKVTAVADRNEKAALATAALFRATATSIERIAQDCDLCIIATPPASHYDLARKCLHGRAAVVVEKPFTGRADEALELASSFSASGRALYVGHIRRYYPSVIRARELVLSGALGTVREIEINEGARFAWSADSSYTTSDPYGGVLYDTGAHAIDMGLFICGLDSILVGLELVGVDAASAEPSHEIRAEFNLIEKERKIRVGLHLSRHRALANQITIHTDRAKLTVSTFLRECFVVGGANHCTRIQVTSVKDPLRCFLDEYESILRGDAERLRADKFINLAQIMQVIGERKELSCTLQ